MSWPVEIPSAGMRDDGIAVSSYSPADAEGLFAALSDHLAWEHIPHSIPSGADELSDRLLAKSADGTRSTFTIRVDGVIVGMTSLLYEPDRPESVEIGGTQLAPAVWGSGINARVKRLLIAAIGAAGFTSVQFRTDERNGRSIAAIRKLGATDLGLRQDVRVRRDGSVRVSRFFRLDLTGGVEHTEFGRRTSEAGFRDTAATWWAH